MGDDSSVSVKWDHHQPVLLQAIKEIYTKEIFADVRLECDGHEHWVHKFILSACSEYFQDILMEVPHRGSITVSSFVQHKQLVSLLDFMYLGEVIVPQEELAELVNAAEVLMVRGFAVPCEEADDEDENTEEDDKNLFNKGQEKIASQSGGYHESGFVDEGSFDNKMNYKRRIGEDDGTKNFKDRRMVGQDHIGSVIPTVSIKEEPNDPDFTERIQYSNQGNRYQQQHQQHMQGQGMCRNNPGGAMGQRQQQQMDVNGGNNTDISNLLNVLIDSPNNKNTQNPNSGKKHGCQNQGQQQGGQMGDQEGGTGFVCPQCRKTFHWRSNLTKHMRTHTGEKPYSCTNCPYKTSYSEALKRHMRIHTGEKPYKCEMCDYKGKDYGSLKSHLKKHAPHHLVPQISPPQTSSASSSSSASPQVANPPTHTTVTHTAHTAASPHTVASPHTPHTAASPHTPHTTASPHPHPAASPHTAASPHSTHSSQRHNAPPPPTPPLSLLPPSHHLASSQLQPHLASPHVGLEHRLS